MAYNETRQDNCAYNDNNRNWELSHVSLALLFYFWNHHVMMWSIDRTRYLFFNLLRLLLMKGTEELLLWLHSFAQAVWIYTVLHCHCIVDATHSIHARYSDTKTVRPAPFRKLILYPFLTSIINIHCKNIIIRTSNRHLIKQIRGSIAPRISSYQIAIIAIPPFIIIIGPGGKFYARDCTAGLARNWFAIALH